MVSISRRHLAANNEKHLRSSCLPVALFLLVGFVLTARPWHRLWLLTETGPCLACVALPIADAFHRLFTVVSKCRNVPSVSEHAVFHGCNLSLCPRAPPAVSHADQHSRRERRRKLWTFKTLFKVNYDKPCFFNNCPIIFGITHIRGFLQIPPVLDADKNPQRDYITTAFAFYNWQEKDHLTS